MKPADSQPATLVLFCRRPALGVGKQRLANQLGAQHALEVSRLLLACALDDLQNWPGPRVIAPASADDQAWATDLTEAARVVPQTSGKLGERIAAVDQQLRGTGKRLYIGSDAPGMSLTRLLQADAALNTYDTVIIPARDGGVTLLGTACQWPDLAELPWETPMLCSELEQRCADSGLSCHVLDSDYDVDTVADLRHAGIMLANDSRTSRQHLCDWINWHRTISVIVPVYRDVPALRSLLVRLRALHTPPAEIIVVAAEAGQACRQLCHDFGVRLLEQPPCRGAQLAFGASQASSDILWFLHADAAPSAAATELIRRHIAGGAVGGYFRFRFTGAASPWSRLLETTINMRTHLGMPYGDQGLFATREAYRAAGGHVAIPLFEEVQLVKNLRKQGRFETVTASIGVSPRRWKRDGWIRRSLRNRLLACGYMLGIAPEKLARAYGQPTSDGPAGHSHGNNRHPG